MKEKVFGIGLQKTGTMTLISAFKMLDYKTEPWLRGRMSQIQDEQAVLKEAIELAERNDACANNPWPRFYKELADTFPDAKFILTVRDEDEWMKSCARYFGKREWPEHEWFYGHSCFEGHEEAFLETYRSHNKNVVDFFDSRGEQARLLVFDAAAGDGWDKLCDFLGTDVPDMSFPHKNMHKTLRSAVQRRAVPYGVALISVRELFNNSASDAQQPAYNKARMPALDMI